LGVIIQDVTPQFAKQYGLGEQTGAIITQISAESPAEKAGLQVEDVVTSINGQKIDDSSRLRLIVSSLKPGASVPMDIIRNGKKLTLTATLEALPEEALAEVGPRGIPRSGGQPQATTELVTGVTVQSLSPALRDRYDVPKNVDGIIVTKVDPNSRAAAMGVEEGDVITHINRQPATNPAEARALAKGSDTTVLLRVFRKGDTMLLMVGNN
ncbi:MAG: PDZ domain-containing protein, partial [Verrucomicrobiaceae bacterium]|nr:PDZ domain-containing protein [Verrucomicrobiaceae bacterium]